MNYRPDAKVKKNLSTKKHRKVSSWSISQIECKKHYTERIDDLDFLKYKNLGSSKDITKQMKKQPTDWEKIFAFHISDNGLISRT